MSWSLFFIVFVLHVDVSKLAGKMHGALHGPVSSFSFSLTFKFNSPTTNMLTVDFPRHFDYADGNAIEQFILDATNQWNSSFMMSDVIPSESFGPHTHG